MERVFQEYLFQKHILVSEGASDGKQAMEVLFSLANLFGISVTQGRGLAREELIRFSSEMLGRLVAEPFYKGFPESVRKLSKDELAFDQMLHYCITYGLGDFSEPGHSVLEGEFQRLAFKENCEIREFRILTEEEAKAALEEAVENLLESSRPLNEQQFTVVKEYVKEYHYRIQSCASKNTVIRLLAELHDISLCRFLQLSDVIKVVDEINFRQYNNENIKKLNFRNCDRKFISKLLDTFFAQYAETRVDFETCYEKKAVWCGLLHHLHYQPKQDVGEAFVFGMRTKGNQSVYSDFEAAMAKGDIREAVTCLKAGKGSGALLRNLNYIVSRVEKPEDLSFVLDAIDTKNNIILLQLLLTYSKDQERENRAGRSFQFVRHNLLRVHGETAEEMGRRKSRISGGQAKAIARLVEEMLRRNLKGKLGRVYVDEAMKKIALPLQESTSNGGFGVLSKGSRLLIPAGKKVRAFTYWEKVNDIDLSVIGLTQDGSQREFSWRTMANEQSDVLTFSGDETSGYNGGSEYFDIDLEGFQALYPEIKSLVFCNNVFSGSGFDKCFCKAGYMMRDVLDTGEIYEPKTVQTSFLIDCPSTFAYLFGIDLEKRELVWLNVSKSGNAIVAGETSLMFLLDYFDVTKTMNVHRFFEMMATELVADPAKADMVVTDREELWLQACNDNEDQSVQVMDTDGGRADQTVKTDRKEWICSYDFDKILRLMNQ